MLKALIKKTPLFAVYKFGRQKLNNFKEARKYTKPTPKSLPNQLFIEITDYCMLKCVMCPRLHFKRGIGFMDFNLYKKIIDEVSKWPKPPAIMLVFLGEPLAHSQFIDFVRYAADKNLIVNTASNGYVLTPQLAEEILSSGLGTITFSLDATTKEVYDQIRIGSDWNKVINNVNFLLDLRRKKKLKKPRIQVSFVIQDKNEHQVKDFINQWINKVDSVYFQRVFDDLPDMTGRQMTKRILFQLDAEKRKPCYYLWNSMVVYWNGEVATCPPDDFGKNVMGDTNKESLKDIWKNESYQHLRKLHLACQYSDEKFTFCKNCDYWRGYQLKKQYIKINGIKVLKEENPLCINYTPIR